MVKSSKPRASTSWSCVIDQIITVSAWQPEAGRPGHIGEEVGGVTKADIASLVAEKGLTKKQAMEAVEATLEIIKTSLQAGEKIQLVGFGSFQVRAKRAN